MANINQVAAEVAQAEAEAIALEAHREAQAKENIEELLERRAQFEELSKAATTLLANINLANKFFDRAAKTDRDLSLEDTEALLSNYDFIGEAFGVSLAAVSEEHANLKESLSDRITYTFVPRKTCPCGCGGEEVALAA